MALIPFSVVLSMEEPQEGVEFHSWNKYISLPKWIAYLIIYKLQTAAALSSYWEEMQQSVPGDLLVGHSRPWL